MGLFLFRRRRMGPGRSAIAGAGLVTLAMARGEPQVLLPAADQLQIDFGQKIGVLEGPVQGAIRIIDLKSPA